MNLAHFLSPHTVAVIGASRNPRKVGHVVFRNFLEGSFLGKVYPVNPDADSICGERSYSSILNIPGKIELAIITIPASHVPAVLTQCGRKHVPAVIIVTAGFAEVGNTKQENMLKHIAKKYNIRLLGPNCLGVFKPATGVDTLFLPRFKLGRPDSGSIAYISQSGATGSVVLDWMAMKGYKLSTFISYGNAADIDEADILSDLAADRQTNVICAYIEGVKNGRKFFTTVRRIKKPVVILKGGQTPAGSAAAASHTGSLAGSAQVYRAAFRQAGIVQADDLEQVFDFARVFATQPKPKGRRVQIITDGGGYGVLTADWIHTHGLTLAVLKPSTVRALKKQLPNEVVIKNPLDLLGDTNTERYRIAIQAAVADQNVDMLAIVVLFQVPSLGGDVIEVIAEARGKKPLVVISGGGKYTETLKKSLEDAGVPTFSYPDRAVAALNALYSNAMKKTS